MVIIIIIMTIITVVVSKDELYSQQETGVKNYDKSELTINSLVH